MEGTEGKKVRHGDVVMTIGDKNVFFFRIQDPVGIHARPAGALVNLSKQFKSEIIFSVGEKRAQAGSIIELMALGAKQGTKMKVEVRGEDEKEALEAVRSFLRSNL